MNIFTDLNMSKYEAQTSQDDEFIDLDELYNRQHSLKLAREENYGKILKRVHNKIKLTSRIHTDQQYLFFVVPEIMIGVPRYNIQHCIAYLVNKLEKNGFFTKYVHPNTLFISWQHYLPQFKREVIKEVHGVNVDKHGNVIEEKPIQYNNDDDFTDPMMLGKSISERNEILNQQAKDKKKVEFNDINQYTSSGIYDKDILFSLNQKIKH